MVDKTSEAVKSEPVKDEVAKGAAGTTPQNGGGQAGTAAAPQAPIVRRGPGTKEVIPFGWKLIGEANGLAMTLFKSIEREDVDAQLIRVQNEGYYSKLRIMQHDLPVRQATASKTEAAARKGTRTPDATKAVKPKKAAKKRPAPKAPIQILIPSLPEDARKTKKGAKKKGGKKASRKKTVAKKKAGAKVKKTTRVAKSKTAVKSVKKKAPSKAKKTAKATKGKTTKKAKVAAKPARKTGAKKKKK